MLPNVRGLITAHDGALILFEFRGRTIFEGDAPGRQNPVGWFESDHESYCWLNDLVCIAEGQIHLLSNLPGSAPSGRGPGVVSEARRYCAVQMVKLQRRPFGEPDDVREIPYGHLETYDMGDIRIGRSVLQPGWRWSESIKPIARTELCEYHHIGLCVSGSHGSRCVRAPSC